MKNVYNNQDLFLNSYHWIMQPNTHGGKRPGAGRKKAMETEVIAFRVPSKYAAKLRVLIKKLIDRVVKKK